jgi:flavin reductase (DIM6/NTAB) family NADH-FMN oxidoreductase RutF
VEKKMKEANIYDLNFSAPREFGRNLVAISVGDENKYNAMTAARGTIGYLWELPVVTIYVRHSRYSHDFLLDNKRFSISFFGGDKKKELLYIGTHSGRDEDKLAKCGIEVAFEDSIPYLKGAKLVLLCESIFEDEVTRDKFIDKKIDDKIYSSNLNYHTVYVGKILKTLVED